VVVGDLVPAGERVQLRVESARRGLNRLLRLIDEQPVHTRLVSAQRAAGNAAVGVRRALHATLVEGETLDASGRSAARALDRLQDLTRPARAPSRNALRPDRRPEAPFRSRNGRAQPIDRRRMGFGLPDSSPRAGAGAGSSVDALARVIELPLARPETISPELALVDPELARLARARLHEPGFFWPGGAERRPAPPSAPTPLRTAAVPAPAVSWGAPLRTAPAPPVSVAAAELLAERTAVARADRFFQPPPPRPLVPGGMAAVAAALLVGVGGGLAWVLPEPTSSPVSPSADAPPVVAVTPGRVSADPPSVTPPTSKQPAAPAARQPGPAAGKPATKDPPKTQPKDQPKARPATPKTIPVLPPASSPPPSAAPATKPTQARTFAWAPAPGATGYEVQLFRGDDRVLVERTSQTRLKIGPKWTYEGRAMALAPGRYRWYVWPLGAGGARSDTPVVQARVLIGAG
jgi:Meckel syndrome type 1 protein